jgi:transcriptional regulator with XRE-family HTH domain
VSNPLDELQTREFSRNLYGAMRAKNLRASDLARLVWGAHPNGSARNRDRISVYLNGKALPERENLEAIARALDVEPNELLPSSKPIGDEPEIQIVLIPHDPTHAVFKCNRRMSLVLACRLAALIAEEDELVRSGKKPQSQSVRGGLAVRLPGDELAEHE